MEEQLDILNEKGKKTGKSDTYKNAHLRGLIHLAVHIWFLNSKGQLLLQKRSKSRAAYPNLWDLSVGGHVSAGQSSLEAAQRETQEELGVLLPYGDFKYLFTLKQHVILNQSTYINNEFNDIYLVHSDLEISELKLQAEEVEEARWIDIKDLEKWVKGEGEKLVSHEEEYKKLFEYLDKNSYKYKA
ncbi:MAG: NUDIX domain-containing protein [Patescibacteria group bacterium]